MKENKKKMDILRLDSQKLTIGMQDKSYKSFLAGLLTKHSMLIMKDVDNKIEIYADSQKVAEVIYN